MNILHKPHLSIRTKLTVPYMILSLFIATAGGFIVTQLLMNSLEERFVNQLIETRKLTSELVVREEERMLGTLRLLTHMESLSEAIRSNDQDRILDLVYPVVFNAEDDSVLVLDSQGEIIASMFRSDGNNEYIFPDISIDMSQLPFVLKVANREVDDLGDKYSGITNIDQGAYFLVSGPIYDADGGLGGIVLVGKALEGIVSQIRQETLAQATIYDLDFNPITSTLPDLPPRAQYDPQIITETKETQSLMRDFDYSNISYTELLGAWSVRVDEDIGFLGTAIPKTFLVRTSNLTRINVTLLFVFTIIMAMLLGLFLSNHITRPILKLKQAATEVTRGNLEVRVDTKGDDEVAVLAESFNDMVFHLNKSEQDLLSAYDKTIEGWGKALELRDQETKGHATRVVELTLDIARELKIDEKEIPHIRRGAFLHDIGKIGIPDTILLKQGSLTDDEWKVMKMHTVYGFNMLKGIEFLHPAMDIPTFHHEKWDGSGYPLGLVGENIPLPARIFAVVDVWDALTNDRPYRKALSDREALDIIQKDSGTHFDPDVVKAFFSVVSKEKVIQQVVKPLQFQKSTLNP